MQVPHNSGVSGLMKFSHILWKTCVGVCVCVCVCVWGGDSELPHLECELGHNFHAQAHAGTT